MRELPRMVAETEISKDVAVRILRKGKEMTLAITLGRLEDFENGNKEDEQVEEQQEPEVAETGEALGMVLAELDPALRTQFKIDDSVAGVVVTEVDPAGPAAEKRVQAGDVIVEVAQEAVATPADVEARIKELADDGRRSVLLLLSNGTGELRFVAVRFDEIAEPEDDKEPAQ